MKSQKKEIPDRQLAAFGRLTVARFMEKDVQYGHLRTKADVLASQMIEGFGAVPIVDEKQRLVGIVSEYDLLAALERGHRWSELSAQDIMTPNPYSVRQENGYRNIDPCFPSQSSDPSTGCRCGRQINRDRGTARHPAGVSQLRSRCCGFITRPLIADSVSCEETLSCQADGSR